ITIVWILLLVAALVLYFKHKEVTNWFVKLATLVVLIALTIIFIMQIVTNPWTLSVFALVICLLSYFTYRKKKA
ncbi:MAG: amino acid permease, partial [Lactococcus lactis]|nr:amino acid permease [Lactococcus lactis]